MSYLDNLTTTVASLSEGGHFGKEGDIVNGVRVVDADTTNNTADKSNLRITDIDAAEVSHLDSDILDYKGGELKGDIQSELGKSLIRDEGFNNEFRSDKKGVYNRDLGDLQNEDKDSYSKTLLERGWVDPSSFASQDALDTFNFGALDRAQRKSEGKSNTADLRRELMLKISRDSLEETDTSWLKGTAGTEGEYAHNTDKFRGSDFVRSDRNALNQVKGIQLDDAWNMGVTSPKLGGYGMLQIVSDVFGYKGGSETAQANIDRIRRDLADRPELKNMEAIDEDGNWTLDGIGEITQYVTSNVMASAPVMAVTLASMATSGITGGASLSIPAMMYSGMTYEAQDEKNITKAVVSGIFQGALDVVGAKFINPNQLLTSGGRKAAAKEMAEKLGIDNRDADRLLANAIKETAGNVFKTQRGNLARVIRGSAITGTGAAAEGITEVLQESLAIWGEGNEVTEEQVKNRLLNALIAGGTLGAGFSAVEAGSEQVAVQQYLDGKALQDKSDAQLVAARDVYDHGQVLSVDEVNAKINSLQLDKKGRADSTQGKSLDQQAEGYKAMSGGVIDTVSDAVPALWKGNLKHALEPYKDSRYGSMLYSTMVGGNGRSGRTHEEARRFYSARNADSKYLDAVSGANASGFATTKDLSRAVEANRSEIQGVIRLVKRGTPVEQAMSLKKVDPQLSAFVSAVAGKQSDITKGTGAKEANLLEKTFDKNFINRNQNEFEGLLQTELGFDAETSRGVTQSLIRNEDFQTPDDFLNAVLNLTENKKGKKGQAVAAAQYKKSFNKFLNDDVMDNIQANATKYGNLQANQEYIGAGGEKISKMLDLMANDGTLDENQKIKLAHKLNIHNQQVSGQYKRIDHKGYNWAMNNVSMMAMLAGLPLAAVSSITESALVIFKSPKPLETAWAMSQITAQEIKAAGNEVLHSLSKGRIPMGTYLHREQLRKAGYLAESQGAAARVGFETSPSQARFVQKFFKINGLTPLTNIQRATRIAMATDAVESWVDQAVLQKGMNNRLYTEAYDNLALLGVDPELMIKYKEHVHNLVDAEGLTEKDRLAAIDSLTDKYNSQLEVAKERFTDMAVAQPFKGNRPQFYNDPRLRMFTMFQGFISTFTANILPTLYGELGGKSSLPATRVKALQTMAAMLAFTYFAQNLKDAIKGKDDEDETKKLTTFQEVMRTVYGSGLLGTGERAIGAVFPLYGENNTATGGAFTGALGAGIGKPVDFLVSESPQLSYLDNLPEIFGDLLSGKTKNVDRDAIKLTPLNVFKDWIAPYEPEKK